jgi:drug/metabolite transporter (DMT)-like permease
MRRPHLNPTFVGIFSVLVWGFSLPLVRLVKEQIGILGWPAITFTAMGVLGFLSHIIRKQPFPGKAVFRNPYFYARWFFFVVNLICVWSALALVSKPFLAFVILLNYLWPTFIILCSIGLSSVTVSRRIVFTAGTLIVIGAIAVEVLTPDILTKNLFAEPHDLAAYGLAIVGAFCWGMYSALSKRMGQVKGSGLIIPIFQITVGLGTLPLSLMPGVTAWNHMTYALAGILVAWCAFNFLAYVIWDYGTHHGNVVLLSLFADFTPWLSLIASHFILDIDIGQKTVLSAVCLVIGAITTRYGTLAKTHKVPVIAQPEAD